MSQALRDTLGFTTEGNFKYPEKTGNGLYTIHTVLERVKWTLEVTVDLVTEIKNKTKAENKKSRIC